MAFKKGSTLPEKEYRHIDCAHAPQCTVSAIFRERTKNGMANFCYGHYLEWLDRDRTERWRAAGSPSAAESMQKMGEIVARQKPSPREHWRNVLAMENPPHVAKQAAMEALGKATSEHLPAIVREPGQDDEERNTVELV